MSGNTSATGGYLQATSGPTAIYDAALQDILAGAVKGVTGLPGSLVRPRWQPEPPPQPLPTTDWCSVGVMFIPHWDFPYIWHNPFGNLNGYDQLQRQEELEVLTSFYGPNAELNASAWRDGMYVQQNNDQLLSFGIRFVSAGRMIILPDLTNSQYINRADVTHYFRRQVSRNYAVLNILTVDVTGTGDQGISDTFEVGLNTDNILYDAAGSFIYDGAGNPIFG